MRSRKVLAGALLVGALAFLGGPALAQEEPEPTTEADVDVEEVTHEAEEIAERNGGEHADVECIPVLLEGGSVDDCHEAPSPILPATNELIWGAISFAVLFFLLAKFAFPGIKKAMDDRAEKIRRDLEQAEQAKADAQQVLEEYRAQLAEAKSEAARIVDEARQQSEALRRDAEQRLQSELNAMRQRAAGDVESGKQQAMADLRREITALAISAAEQVVRHNLDQATQEQLVEAYIHDLASRRN